MASISNVRLLPNNALVDDPIVALVQAIRNKHRSLCFVEYIKEAGDAFTNGESDYEGLLETTRDFINDNADLKFKGGPNPKFDFNATDVTDTNRRFPGEALNEADLEAASRKLDRGPDGKDPQGDNVGALYVEQMRRAQLPGGPETASLVDGRLKNFVCVELIWSYWMEQAGLVQGMNAITMRYQNQAPLGADRLARCDISHLHQMSSLLWGYIQDEHDRLSLARRTYEYDHHYGLRLRGNAVPVMRPADSRTTFLDAFHRLLNGAARYYQLSMNTTMQADAYPSLHAIKEVSLILEEGMHNQYTELPKMARAEMLIQQAFLAQPDFRFFLGGRPSITYPEPWMPQLETLRTIMGWNDASIRHYYDLAVHGEVMLLTLRAWPWANETSDSVAAAWLQSLRPEIQAYIHAYRAVTGVNLAAGEVQLQSANQHASQPADLIALRRQRAGVRNNGRL
ncbi:MAG TPA: hypothetical protein VD971_08245 [Phycisphaerales bacterium]|nr:hypothetical protein [Phycisphaerales bacterium]